MVLAILRQNVKLSGGVQKSAQVIFNRETRATQMALEDTLKEACILIPTDVQLPLITKTIIFVGCSHKPLNEIIES